MSWLFPHPVPTAVPTPLPMPSCPPGYIPAQSWPPNSHPPFSQPSVPPKGCICPPTSEKTCQRWDCGRKDVKVEAR